MNDNIKYFIQMTRDKYPEMAKKGWCWAKNIDKQVPILLLSGEVSLNPSQYSYIESLEVDKWNHTINIPVLEALVFSNLKAYSLSGKVMKDIVPMFVNIVHSPTLKLLKYRMPLTLVMTKKKKKKQKLTRADLMDLDDD